MKCTSLALEREWNTTTCAPQYWRHPQRGQSETGGRLNRRPHVVKLNPTCTLAKVNWISHSGSIEEDKTCVWRRSLFKAAKQSSIGLSSGQYGGRYSRSTPTSSHSAWTLGLPCMRALSHTNIELTPGYLFMRRNWWRDSVISFKPCASGTTHQVVFQEVLKLLCVACVLSYR